MEFYEDPHETSRAIYEQIMDILGKNGPCVNQITVDRIPFFSYWWLACFICSISFLVSLSSHCKWRRSTRLHSQWLSSTLICLCLKLCSRSVWEAQEWGVMVTYAKHRREENWDNFKSHRSTGTVLDYTTKVIKWGVWVFPRKTEQIVSRENFFFSRDSWWEKRTILGKTGRVATLFATDVTAN